MKKHNSSMDDNEQEVLEMLVILIIYMLVPTHGPTATIINFIVDLVMSFFR